MIQDFFRAYTLIQNAKNILITNHHNPDGDALGSICAINHYLENINKKYTSIVDSLPETYTFLPGIHTLSLTTETNINVDNFDLIITVDFNSIDRCPISSQLKDAIKKNINIITFDHHQLKHLFANVNLIDPESASTTNIIYKFFMHHDIPISKEIATCLLTGILTDTGHFSNSGTTSESIDAAATLLLYGAHYYQINKNTIQNNDIQKMKIWGDVLSRLTFNEDLQIAYTVITQKNLAAYNVTSDAIDGISNFLNNLYGVKAVLVLKEENDGTLRGSFRSTHPDIDVSLLAKQLGGGGHKKAAGFTIKGQLQETENGWKIK